MHSIPSYEMGVDSSALLAKSLLTPLSYSCPFEELIVITAQAARPISERFALIVGGPERVRQHRKACEDMPELFAVDPRYGFFDGAASDQLAAMQADFARISGRTQDLAIYTSNVQGVAQENAIKGFDETTPKIQPEMNLPASVSVPEIAREGFSRGR